MQPLIKAMPEVMMVSRLMSTWPEMHPLLAGMERESMTRQAGFAGILARLADVVAALILRGWVEGGCGKATGWVQVLREPRLSRASNAMHQQPGLNWKSVADLAKKRAPHAPCLPNGFWPRRDDPGKVSQRTENAAGDSVHSSRKSAIETVALRLGYGSLAAFSRAFKRIIGDAPGTLREAGQAPEEILTGRLAS